MDALESDGLDQAQRAYGIKPIEVGPPTAGLEGSLRNVANSGTDLFIVADLIFNPVARAVARTERHTTFVYLDIPEPGAASISFAGQESAYLAGAAAALTSKSGTIGFVSGSQIDLAERARAGYEAGAHAMKPGIRILERYASTASGGFLGDSVVRAVAEQLYRQGADVVYAPAAWAQLGAVEAAQTESKRQGKHLWIIGADADEYLSVDPLLRPFVLTSTIKRYDVAIKGIVRDFLHHRIKPVDTVLGLTDGGVDLATTGDRMAPNVVSTVAALRADIIAHRRHVPTVPRGTLEPPPGRACSHTRQGHLRRLHLPLRGPSDAGVGHRRPDRVRQSDHSRRGARGGQRPRRHAHRRRVSESERSQHRLRVRRQPRPRTPVLRRPGHHTPTDRHRPAAHRRVHRARAQAPNPPRTRPPPPSTQQGRRRAAATRPPVAVATASIPASPPRNAVRRRPVATASRSPSGSSPT